jgi:hypothetical protein
MKRAFFALLLAGCATTGDVSFDRCHTGRVIDGCSPADYPALNATLPPWPFPVLIEEPKEQPQPSDTPAHRLLQKLTK